jgi:hypothetical protein
MLHENRFTLHSEAYSHSQATTASSSEESRPVKTIHPPRQLAARAYYGTVEDAQVLAFAWRCSTTNPDGLCLRLRVLVQDENGPAHLFDCVDTDHQARLHEIYEAAGLPVPVDPVAEAHTLTGQRVRVAVKNIIPKQGRHAGVAKAVVSSWIVSRQ